MNHLARLGVLLLLFAPSSLFADAIVVRSGEHEDFTRLVMRLPDRVNWQIETTGNRSRLSLEGFDQGFDLTSAFSIIPRTRLQALVARQSELDFQLGCECSVTAFLEQNGYLVVDISDANSSVPTASAIEATNQLPATSFSFGELLWRSEQSSPTIEHVDDEVPDDRSDEVNQQELSRLEIVAETQRRLTEAYSRAASLGLVEPKEEPLPPAPSNPNTETNAKIYDPSEVTVLESTSLGDNIRITSSKDVPEVRQPENIGALGGACPDPERINIAQWANSEDLSTQIAQSNQRLFDDLGRVVEDEVVNRARLYIHLGFGAEASQTLNMVPTLPARYPEMIDLAQVLEHGFMPNPRVLHRHADCNSDYALWGVLSAEDLPDDRAVDVQAALRGLEKLPGHLKAFLGPELSDRLVQRGDLENAMIAIRSFERLPETDNTTPKLVNAQIQELRDDPVAANEILAGIVENNTPETPHAVQAIVEKHLEDGSPVPADIALLAETYAIELRNTPDAAEIFRTHVIAAAKSKQYNKAFDAIANPPSQISVDQRTALLDIVISEVSKNAGNLEFLEQYYAAVQPIAETLNDTARIALAKRLIDLGFRDAASTISPDFSTVQMTEKTRVVAAELLLVQGNYAKSLQYLENLDGQEALRLRARAEQELGRFGASAETLRNADQAERAIIAAWLSDTWDESINSDDPTFGPAKRVAETEVKRIEVNDDMLAISAQAVEASGLARAELNNLLDNLQVEE